MKIKETVVSSTRDRAIVLRPVTKEYIRSFRGIFKSRPDGKPATQELLDDRSEDLRREESKVE